MIAIQANWSHLCLVSKSNDDRTQHTVGSSLTSVAGVKILSLEIGISTGMKARMGRIVGPMGGRSGGFCVIVR